MNHDILARVCHSRNREKKAEKQRPVTGVAQQPTCMGWTISEVRTITPGMLAALLRAAGVALLGTARDP